MMSFGYSWSRETAEALLWQEMLRRQAGARPEEADRAPRRAVRLRRLMFRILPRLAQAMFR